MHQPSTMFEVRTRHTFVFSINRPGDLELLASNLGAHCPSGGHFATDLPILVFLGLFVLDLWANTLGGSR